MQTGLVISETVEKLLLLKVSQDLGSSQGITARRGYSTKMSELADHLGVSEKYLPRKIKSGTWSAGDLDQLAQFFAVKPVDLVSGQRG